MELRRLQKILTLGLPIIGGMLSQSLLNLVDAAMVGSLGEIELAGVGIGGYATFMATALIFGLSSGVQAMVARRHGEARNGEQAVPLNGGLLIALCVTVPLTLLFWQLAPWIIRLINQDPEVVAVAVPYFQWRISALLAIGLNFSFRGYWNGIHRSSVYLRIIIMMHALNILISYSLIFGAWGLPALGAPGSGLGTAIALTLGALCYAFVTWRFARPHGFLHGIPDRHTVRTMLSLWLPNSLQQFLFASGFMALFWIISQINASSVAVAHVLVNLGLFLILPAVGMGMAATTLVGHSLGREAPDEAYRWGWDVVKVAAFILLVLGLPMWLVPDVLLSLFLHKPELIALGEVPLRLTGLAICLDAIAIVFTQALLGAGANRMVMKVSISMQWLFFLPLAWLVGPALGYGLLAIWWVQVLYRALSSLIFGYLWIRRGWITIQI